MAEMQAVLLAMATVHASGKHAGAHAASGKGQAGGGFFQALSAQIESSLASEFTAGKGLAVESLAAEGQIAAGVPLPGVGFDPAHAKAESDMAAASTSAQMPVPALPPSQDPLLPMLAMMWPAAAPTEAGSVASQAEGRTQATEALAAMDTEAPWAVAAGHLAGPADSAKADRRSAHGPSENSANLADHRQSLPPAIEPVAPQPAAPSGPSLVANAKAAALDGQAEMQTAGLQTPLSAPQSGGPAEQAGAAVGLEPSRDLLAQRVFEQLPRNVDATGLQPTLQAPLRSAAFNSELGDRLVWMATRHTQSAELTLNPPQLGSIEVRLSMNGNEAGAQFYSANPQVREALDQALPKLREIMAGAGINLGQATVSDQAFSRQDQPTGGQKPGTLIGDEESLPLLGGTRSLHARAGMGLVDLYA